MPKSLSPEVRERYRERLAKSALAQKSFITPRDLETIRQARSYRVHAYFGNAERREVECSSYAELKQTLATLSPVDRDRSLVYAVWGDRQALIPWDHLRDLLR